ncbi:hypothetical protein GCM10010347_21310 [Streptomyces cirratus]|uniref:Uncharacterized protein n=1 Tax=Streptomyces cirratus TaxID=68187 RepID=A0ABQ3EQ58_9ACTN|nr:hypothetical protein GCM10010347_21310 [Streptomyces cirratus]
MDRDIRTVEDVLRLLDGLFAPDADRWTAGAASWWDGFYADRSRPVPFFEAKPDENLVSYVDRGLVAGGPGARLGVWAGAQRALPRLLGLPGRRRRPVAGGRRLGGRPGS